MLVGSFSDRGHSALWGSRMKNTLAREWSQLSGHSAMSYSKSESALSGEWSQWYREGVRITNVSLKGIFCTRGALKV